MPSYRYLAKKTNGENVKGLVEAPNIKNASEILKDKQLIIISLKENPWQQVTDFFLNVMNRVRSKDVVFFARQLSVMLEANVPVVKSLHVLIKQTTNPYFKLIIGEIVDDVDGGAKLSQALKRYPKIFDNFFVYLVRAGETTGRLDKVLVYLADQIEKDLAIKGRIKGAMIYPCFIFGVLIVMGIGMMVLVVPKFVSIFEQSSIQLPLPTRILIGTSDFFVNYWWLLVIFVGVLASGIYLYSRNKAGHYYLDLIKIKIPVIGTIIWKTIMVRFSRSLSSLLTSGVPVTKSLQIVAEIVNNDVYRKIFFQTAEEVEVGKTISSILMKEKNVPLLVTNMISVGEESGKIDKVLVKVADFYESETDTAIKTMVSLIEPIILIVIGLAAMGLILSIILPMYQLTESFSA